MLSRQSTTRIDIGLATELWVLGILNAINIQYQHTGCLSGHIFDIIALDAEACERGLQVKTASLSKEGYHVVPVIRGSGAKYPKNTLIVGVDIARTVYFLAYSHEVDCDAVSISFNVNSGNQGKYFKFVYRDLVTFINRLISMIPNAVDVSTVEKLYSASGQQEADMIANLRRHHLVEDPITPYGDVDCAVDTVPVQLKSKLRSNSDPNQQTLDVDLYHTVDLEQKPYSADTAFKCLIVQNLEYPDDFLVIPKATLLKYGLLTNEIYKGRTKLTVPRDPTVDHWLSFYWNRFDLLTAVDFQPPKDDCDPMIDYWLSMGHEAYTDRSSLVWTSIVVNDIRIKVCFSSTEFFKLTGSSEYQAVIFIRGSTTWLIPMEILVHRQYVAVDGTYLKTAILMNNEHWQAKYRNNLDSIFQPIDLITDGYDYLAATWRQLGHQATVNRQNCSFVNLTLNDGKVEVCDSSTNMFHMKDCRDALGICFMNDTDMWLVPRKALIDHEYLDKEGKCLKPTFLPNTKNLLFATFLNNPISLLVEFHVPEDRCEKVARLYREQGRDACVDRKHLKALKITLDKMMIKVSISTGDSAGLFHKLNNKARPYCVADNYYAFLFLRPNDVFYLIPVTVLTERGYIGTVEGEGTKHISLHDGTEWIKPYRNVVV